jgi:succinate dehydrogenase/fumarate reductase flavoprotein subunit
VRSYETDVLVIGAGGAGLTAAYQASREGGRVLLASKGRPLRSGATVMAPGAIAGAGPWSVPGDSPDVHFRDTVVGGAYLGEQSLVRLVVDEVPELIVELERVGALWERESDGRTYALRIDGGHEYARCPFLEDRTGRELLRALAGELRKRAVPVVTEVMILSLLRDDGRVVGAAGLDLATCTPVLFRAGAVILACGGAGNAYANTSCPTGVTGDGYALAYDAGAELMDMEFVQFFPLGFCTPQSLRGCLGGLLFHVHLLNSCGERFMERWDPERMELSTRDRVSRAMFVEVKEGRGSPHGGVFADMSYHEPGYIARMQPALAGTYRKIGFDPEHDLLELAPTCHFFMGGARVDEHWATGVDGLFACGENAAGVHGANRLSQNALSDLLVSGTRAGRAAAAHAREHGPNLVEPDLAREAAAPAERLLARDAGVSPSAWRDRLRRLMWENAGVYRTGQGLRFTRDELDALAADLDRQALTLRSRRLNAELAIALENRFLLITSRMIVEGALGRTESRGAHWREDHPDPDDGHWLRHLVMRERDGRMAIESVPTDLRELRPGGSEARP